MRGRRVVTDAQLDRMQSEVWAGQSINWNTSASEKLRAGPFPCPRPAIFRGWVGLGAHPGWPIMAQVRDTEIYDPNGVVHRLYSDRRPLPGSRRSGRESQFPGL